MIRFGLALALLALTASSARSAAVAADWRAFKAEDARVAQKIIDAFPNEPYHSDAVRNLKKTADFEEDMESTITNAVLRDRVAIGQAYAGGEIGYEKAYAERARLDKALDIHLSYLYGSIIPRGYDMAVGKFVSASLRATFQERFTRADYLSQLAADPMLADYGPGTVVNVSRPVFPASSDGR
jgi:hypothetical protein